MSFAVVAPFKELAEQVEEVCRDLNYNAPIAIGDLNDGLRQTEKILKEKGTVEAIVSRGGTAKLIEEHFNIPVISIEISAFDVMKAIAEAQRHGGRIGVIAFKNIFYGIDELSQFFATDILEFKYSSESEVPATLEKALELGTDVIVGDNYASELAKKAGIKTVRIQSGKEAIAIALRQAEELARVRKAEKVKAEQLRTILETVHEGIITADARGDITLVNTAAEKMLRKDKDQLIGKSIYTVADREQINKVLKEGKRSLGNIYKSGSSLLVQNISPVVLNNELQRIVITMNDSEYVENVETQVRKELYSKGYIAKYNFSDIVTNSRVMKNVIKKAYHFAQTDLNILIVGESGTGKEMIVQSIHNASRRRNGPFIAINSAAMSENLLESELFGYEEGAFTGARKGGKKGLFELAHNGTLFLDEIGEMPMGLQSKLLRVLQERSIMRVGGDKVIFVNTRIIAATHVDLRKAVEEGKFRKDLFYRLNVLNINIPPLEERKEDIPLLFKVLNERISREMGVEPPIYTDEILDYLSQLRWDGNVRQIENVVARIAILYSGEMVSLKNITEVLDSQEGPRHEAGERLQIKLDTMDRMEFEIIEKVMERTNNDKDKTCEILGIGKTTLWRKLKQMEAIAK